MDESLGWPAAVSAVIVIRRPLIASSWLVLSFDGMRQLITRIDEDLHRRLKRRAASQGRSVNAMVSELLRSAVDRHDERQLVRARLRALGRLAYVPRPRRLASHDAAIATTRGLGKAASEALADDRRRQ
jgi:plasmid stability protein